jgi:hypothetical protein
MRKMHDNYPTPVSIVQELVRRWVLPDMMVWEPCAGDGRFADTMRSMGCAVISSDISMGKDFFDYRRTLAPTLVTNPPFKHIRPFIDHAFSIGVEKMALVCPKDCGPVRRGANSLSVTGRGALPTWTGVRITCRKVAPLIALWRWRCGSSLIRRGVRMKCGARVRDSSGN